MGKKIKFKCNNCGYEADLFLGVGMNSRNQRIIEKTLTGNDLEEWKAWMSSDNEPSSYSENFMGICETCGELQTICQITCTNGIGDKKEITPVCSNCHHERKLVKEWEKKDVECPKCKIGKMESSIVGMWD